MDDHEDKIGLPESSLMEKPNASDDEGQTEWKWTKQELEQDMKPEIEITDPTIPNPDDLILASLGANVVDQVEFEEQFIKQLENEFKDNAAAKTRGRAKVDLDKATVLSEGVNADAEVTFSALSSEDRDGGTETSNFREAEMEEPRFQLVDDLTQSSTEVHGLEESSLQSSADSNETTANEFDPEKNNSTTSSILQNLLEKGRETATEKKIRTGEMTPFGSSTEKSAQKKDSFLNFSRYMATQQVLEKEHVRKTKVLKKKDRAKARPSKSPQPQTAVPETSAVGRGVQSSSTKEPGPSNSSNSRLQQKRDKDPLKMSILFPKKKKRKEQVGLGKGKRNVGNLNPGKSMAESSSMYMRESEDSDFRPPSDSELDSSDSEDNAKVRMLRKSSNRRKVTIVSDQSSSDDYDYTTDTDCEDNGRPVKRRKLEGDDGDVVSYQNRVQKWKEQETRFTGNYHKVDGDFKLPVHLWDSLYNYQKVGVKWLWELHQQRCGGILGDEMGLGKTIQIIGFFAGLASSNLLCRFSKYRGLGPSIIICPATVMHQWVKEFHVWWPPLRVVILHESGSYTGTKETAIQRVNSGNGVLITTYVGIVNNITEILKYSWDYLILDEGHKIRNPNAQVTLAVKKIPTPHRIILSGSPIQNNLKELWSLFDFIYPGKLGTLPVFLEQFAVPITQGGYSNANQVQVAAAFKCATTLRNVIKPYLLRRMKSDVNTHLNLPSKSEQVLFCKLTSEQKALYLRYLESDETKAIINGKGNPFVAFIHLRKICNHPHLYDGGPKLLKTKKNGQSSSSGKKAKKSSKSFNSNGDDHESESDVEVNFDSNEKFGHWKESGKLIVVRTLLKLWKDQGHKVLLFTQSRQMLCILENFMRNEEYSYLRLDGSTPIGSRQPLIKKFNEDESIFIFILTTRVGGLGINLTGANRVILFDPDWNPSTDLQARERAWRIGQERQVTIYRLVTSGTIEEKIYHRQIFKQFLTNRVLKDPRQKRFFKSNDMLELFTFNEGTEEGTETEAIFAGTDSVTLPSTLKKRRARERASGKLRNVPNLVKQSTFKTTAEDEGDKQVQDTEKEGSGADQKQDDYVLRKLFKRSVGVEAALKHDNIMEGAEPDYLLVEKEAERVAKEAISVLRKSREQCWSADSGMVTWTGSSGSIRPTQPLQSKPKLRFGSKKPSTSQSPGKTKQNRPSPEPNWKPEDFFSNPLSDQVTGETPLGTVPISSSNILEVIKTRKRNSSLVEPNQTSNDPAEENPEVKPEYMDLLRDIREFIAFRAMIDGQATTTELISEFGTKLPAKNSPLFKQMLNQLCTSRTVEGQRIWRLKPEFR